MEEGQNADEPSDDDAEYYRQEVGEEPEEGWCLIESFLKGVLKFVAEPA